MNRFIKTLLLAAVMLFSSSAIAQQPQTQTAPLYAVNAKYTNGVAPGYYATSGGGLTLNIGGGTVFCSGTIAQYAGGSLTVPNNATNYVYLNASASCAPAVKTSVFTSTDIPLFEVVTSGSAIISVLDVRTPFSTGNGGSGGLTLPLTSALTWSPTSLGLTSLQNELLTAAVTGTGLTITASNSGTTNYTALPTLTQSGGVCSTAPTIRDSLVSGAVIFQLTNQGICTTAPTVTVGGDATGTGASVTLGFEGATVQTTTTGVPFLDLNTGNGQNVLQTNPFITNPVVNGLTLAPGGISLATSISVTNCANPILFYNVGLNFVAPCSASDIVGFSPGNTNSAQVRFEPIVAGTNSIVIYSTGNGTQTTNNSIAFNPYNLATGSAQPLRAGFNWLLANNSTLVVTAFNGGTGYTGAGTCVLSGGTQLSGGTDTCSTSLVGGVLALAVTTNGLWSSPPTATITGATGGTGAMVSYVLYINHVNTISGSFWQDATASHTFHLSPIAIGTTINDWMSVSGSSFLVPSIKPSAVSCLHIDNTGNITPTSGDCATGGSGSVTSIGVTTPAWLTVTGSPITTAGTIAITGTSEAANLFLASPNGTTGALGPRAIVSADIPTLNQNTTGTAANLSGTPALPNGTTGTTQTVGDNTAKLATDAFVLANAGSPAFNTIGGGTNTTAAMLVGTGASLGATGSGTISATSVPASGLTGSTLASGVTSSSLTSLGTITTGVWTGSIIGAQFGGTGLNTSAATGCPTVTAGTWSIAACGSGTITGSGTNGFLPIWTGTSTLGNSLLDYAVTTAGTFTFSKPIAVNATGVATQINLIPSGTSPATVTGASSLGVPNTVTTSGVYLLPAAPGSGVYTGTNASGIVTTTFTALNGTGAGIVTGPASSTTNNAVVFTGAAGQIADSGGPMPATLAAVSHQFFTSYTKSTGVFTLAQPTLADIAAGATSTGTYDFSGATQIKLPVAAAYVSAANGEIGYDTTNLNWHIWNNAADNFVAVFPVASPPTSGNCVKFIKTTNTWTIADAGSACGGSALPTSTAAGQGLYYPSSGSTTVAVTSDITHTGAAGGSPLGFNNTTPLSVFDFVGSYSNLGQGPTSNTTTNGSLTNVATSMTVVSTAGYPPSGYLVVGSTNFTPEIMAYSIITSGTVFGGLTRSLFGTTAANPQTTGASVLLISAIQSDSSTVSPSYLKIWRGGAYCYPTNSNLFNNSTLANGNFGCGNIIYATSFSLGSSAGGASWNVSGTGMNWASAGSTILGTLNGAGLMTTSGNSVALTTATTITGTSFTTTGLVLPSVPISTTIHGHCSIIWEQNTVVGTVQFGIGGSAAPTDLYVMNKIFPGSTVVPAYTTITSATTTAISATSIPGTTATGYSDDIDFTLITGGTNAVVLTIYGLTSVGTSALVIEPGSSCGWLL